ncbi:MAG: DUF4268 domain-containing protein [Paludibacteraceae bacterium]|nr:DUF4268 domain-containing protein [Paludibacteraceae bacterium]
MEKIKYVHRQDSGFKLSAGNSGETSLNLSNEIFDLITKGSMKLGEERNVTFKLYKEDCIKAVCFIILKLPLYQSSSNASTKVVDNLVVFQNLIGKINYFFGENEIVDYTVNLYYRTDGRIYLNRLKVDGFSIRDVLVENNSALLFKEESNGKIALRILSDIKDGETVDAVEQEIQPSLPLQQIFYGAPGTGKSHKVNKEIQNTANALVFRTTFHPDSDYSTFVGAYKPTMKSADRLYSADELIDKLSEIKTLGHTYPCHKFAAKYWYSLKGLSAADIKRIVVACDFPESMTVEVGKGIAIGEEMAKHVQNDKIVYSFVPQAFLKAYVAAWQNPEQPIFLVIEEINRGNCAQIFGDIFQLLDRKDDVSEYPIKADQDIRDYLAKEFAGYDLEANILSGEELVLPANLHIWATMNTSDQSLFPIDSAFKRRWDWKYMPIHDAGENWTIALSDVEYDWWDFVEKINNVIGYMTSSEDKKLGYFFCKACNGKIDAEKFVNKVVFYLWNDVFKDYELSDKAFQDGDDKLTFNKFYTPSGDANEATIKTLMENMGVELKEINHEPESEEDENELEDSTSPVVALRKQKCKEFWTDFLQYAQNNSTYMSIFSGRKTPTTDHWYTYNVFGRPLTYLCVDQFRRRNELVVSISMDKPSFAKLAELYKNEIEQKLQRMDLKWVQDLQKSTTKSNIREVLHVTNFEDPIERQQLFIHIVDRLIRMYGVFNEYFGKISE